MRKSLKLLLADDHAILRSGLKRLLSELPDVAMIGEATDGDRVIELVRSERWDVLVLDLEMPGPGPIDVLKRVKAEQPDLGVLVLSMYPEDRFALRMLRAGAAGYLNKRSAAQQLVTAIHLISEGGTYISANLAAELARDLDAKRVSKLLSDREFTVLRGVASGKSISAIAGELNLSAKTVSTYRARLLAKLKLRNNVELALYATEHGLVT